MIIVIEFHKDGTKAFEHQSVVGDAELNATAKSGAIDAAMTAFRQALPTAHIFDYALDVRLQRRRRAA